MKLVLAVIGEGTNVLSMVNDISSYANAEKFFEAGDLTGDLIALLTIKLY